MEDYKKMCSLAFATQTFRNGIATALECLLGEQTAAGWRPVGFRMIWEMSWPVSDFGIWKCALEALPWGCAGQRRLCYAQKISTVWCDSKNHLHAGELCVQTGWATCIDLHVLCADQTLVPSWLYSQRGGRTLLLLLILWSRHQQPQVTPQGLEKETFIWPMFAGNIASQQQHLGCVEFQ